MKNLTYIALALVICSSCANESSPDIDKANFVRIYDNNKFNASYFPIDIKQTPDGGYLILGGRRIADPTSPNAQYYSGTYLLKTDNLGAIVLEKEVATDIVNPIGPLLEVNSKYYFFSMEPKNIQTQLSEVDPSGTITKTTLVGGSYPAAAYNDNGNFVLLRYDDFSKQSVVTLVSPSGNSSNSKGFSVGAGDGVEKPIVEHFLRTGRQFPFQVGKTLSGQYFFSGFYNYTFSLVFTNLTANNPQGVVQGNQDDGGFSCVMPLDGNRYAGARFSYGDNYLMPNITLTGTGITSSVDLEGNNLLELAPNATVKMLTATINGKECILYGSNTRGKQIGLYGYNKADGKFIGSRYLGFSNPFEIAAFTTTSDGGLAVCGTTFIAGRFPRICLFKISKEELSKSFQ
ncbi:MAG: hypothetical protein ACK5QG_18635 [Bacteroidota bacterium]|nr:hypothetical protein [Cytophagales bacterium]MCE2957261.1 hypothetical protein [Flammeovirgaceae bacterium]